MNKYAHLEVGSIYVSYDNYIGKYVHFVVIGIQLDGQDTIVSIKVIGKAGEAEENAVIKIAYLYSEFLRLATKC
jgi:hypothetical protein